MVDPLYRALVLAALGLAGCEDSHAPDAGTEVDAGQEPDVASEDASAEDVTDAGGEEDAPCPADAELDLPPCYLIL